MTVEELRERLNELAELGEVRPDTELRIGIRPSSPLRCGVVGLAPDVEAQEAEEESAEPADVLWIVASEGGLSGESPYAPRDLWEVAR